jgi:hypothetical protein
MGRMTDYIDNEDFMVLLKKSVIDFINVNDMGIRMLYTEMDAYTPDKDKNPDTYEDRLTEHEEKVQAVMEKIFDGLVIAPVTYSMELPTEKEIRNYFE